MPNKEFDRPTILVLGNLSDGFRFIGPFPSFDAATEYQEKHHPQFDNWIATLELVNDIGEGRVSLSRDPAEAEQGSL